MALQVEETLIVGGEDSFMQVRHLVLRGSNREIGHRLAEIARDRHNVRKIPWTDPRGTSVQRAYLRLHYPIHYERMRGVADAFGMDLDDASIDFSALPYYVGFPGCSVVYYPPSITSTGHAMFSRNNDFMTGTVRNMLGLAAEPGEKPMIAEPYLMEVYPDEGYPSLYLSTFDLLGACTDGINSEGLVVGLAADDESMARFPMQPTYVHGVGLQEMVVQRFLLDTCATVEEAKEALLLNKHYYAFAPCHYMIGDRHGRSFVWEYSHAHNKEYIIEGDGRPQIMTNFLLHRYQSVEEMPEEDEELGRPFSRYRTLRRAIEAQSGKLTPEFMKQANACVAFDDKSFLRPAAAPTRTLWHDLYDTDERSMEVDFYLRDEPDPETPGRKRSARSGYFRFQLSC
jgi:hypothetical protein